MFQLVMLVVAVPLFLLGFDQTKPPIKRIGYIVFSLIFFALAGNVFIKNKMSEKGLGEQDESAAVQILWPDALVLSDPEPVGETGCLMVVVRPKNRDSRGAMVANGLRINAGDMVEVSEISLPRIRLGSRMIGYTFPLVTRVVK